MSPEPSLDNWQNILWAEGQSCNDKDYARRLYESCDGYKNPFAFNPPRPLAHTVEHALYTACRESNGARFVWQKRLKQLEQEKRKSTPTSKLITTLQDHHWFERFLARQVLLHRGAETIPSLQLLALEESGALKQTAIWLIDSICAETTARLGRTADQWVCPNCFTRCHQHQIEKVWQPDPIFYGCRYCRRSCNLLYCPAGIVAQLDSGWRSLYQQKDSTLFVNWSMLRTLFDFDEVEIVRATNEDVERFAVQIGNDTDPIRRPHYQAMSCHIDPACHLSANTVRILENTFGRVEQGNVKK